MKTIGIRCTFCALGFSSLIAQALFLREFLAISFGNELTLGIALAVWLSGITLGALISPKIGRSFNSADSFAFILAALAILGLVELLLIRSSRLILGIQPGQIVSMVDITVAALFGVMPFGIAVGWAFPVATRVATSLREKPNGGVVGQVYVLEAFGALLGGLAFTFVFLTRLNGMEILVSSGIVLTVCGTLFCRLLSVGRPIFVLLATCSLLFIFLAITPLSAKLETFSEARRWEGINPSMTHRLSLDSRYQHIDVGSIDEQLSLYANGQFVTSFPDEYSNVPSAHLIMSVLPEWSKPEVLILGGGSLGILPAAPRKPSFLVQERRSFQVRSGR